jgi:hypothetical protein
MRIKFTDIEMAFEFVSSEQPEIHTAIISKSSGQTYYHTEIGDNFEEITDDAYENEDYAEIPHKNDLDLGQRLVWRFVEKEIPGLEPKVRGFFSRRGAYSRYKAFLDEIDLLEKWYAFENSETQKALRAWCEVNDIEIDG